MTSGDVEGRLAQGRAAVDDVEVLVRACQHVGYQHPDLTARAGQVGDWYDAERGLRLDALSADADALRAMAAAADDAVRRQADSLTALSAAWSGRGAGSALDFLTRHQHAAATVGTAVREAAETLTSLRDELWRAVDAKVAATQAIDVSGRADWLAAAHTVTSGAGDRSSATELVDQQVKPFVDGVVGGQWVAAMRAGTEAVDAAYRDAVTRLRAATGVLFEVPGRLGPPQDSAQRVERAVDQGVTAVPGPAVAPAASTAPAAYEPPPAPQAAEPAPANPVVAASDPLQPIAPTSAPSPLGDPGGGPSLGSGSAGSGLSGLSGFGQQLADLIGGLVGGSGDDAGLGFDGPDDVDPDDLDDDPDDDDPHEDEPDDEDAEVAEEESGPEPPPTDPAAAVAESPVVTDEPAATVDAAPTPVPAPVTAPPVDAAAVPPIDPAATPPEPTPCEIAADELPQVGG